MGEKLKGPSPWPNDEGGVAGPSNWTQEERAIVIGFLSALICEAVEFVDPPCAKRRGLDGRTVCKLTGTKH